MRRFTRPLLISVAAAGLGLALAGAALAQVAPTVGAVIKDPEGKALGVIEKVVPETGAPRQVLVRDGRVLRTLPIRGLTQKDGGFVTVLSKAEFMALPVSD